MLGHRRQQACFVIRQLSWRSRTKKDDTKDASFGFYWKDRQEAYVSVERGFRRAQFGVPRVGPNILEYHWFACFSDATDNALPALEGANRRRMFGVYCKRRSQL